MFFIAKHSAVSKLKYFLLCFPKQSNRFRSWSTGSTLNGNQSNFHCICLSLQLRQEASQQGQGYSGKRGLATISLTLKSLKADFKGSASSLQLHNDFCHLLFVLWLICCGSSLLFYSLKSWVSKDTLCSTEAVQLVLPVRLNLKINGSFFLWPLLVTEVFTFLWKEELPPTDNCSEPLENIWFTFSEGRGKVCSLLLQPEGWKNQSLTNHIFGDFWTTRTQPSSILLIPHFSKSMEPVMNLVLKTLSQALKFNIDFVILDIQSNTSLDFPLLIWITDFWRN